MFDSTLTRDILVVDDDPMIREVITTVLMYGGYSPDNVHTARNGREALRHVADHRPSLVLLDISMPFLDGPRFLQVARAQGCDAPVVLVTSARNPGNMVASCGAEGFITKPFRPAHLLAEVERFISAT